jgi:hypothetical protein
MNFLINLSPAQCDWVAATARALDVDPLEVVFQLIRLGQPVLEQQIVARAAKPRLYLVRP